MVTFGGDMMAFPSIQVQADGVHLMWVRHDWLDMWDLEVPTTMDELKDVLRVFIENGRMGISGQGAADGELLYTNFLRSNNNAFGLDPIFGAHNAFPGFWIERDGDVVYGSILPETRETLQVLADMYAEGLIDRELGIRGDRVAPMASGEAGLFFGPWWMGYWPLPDSIANEPEADWQAYAFPVDDNGQFNNRMGVPATEFIVVRNGFEHPEAVVKMMNLLVRDESLFDLDALPIGMYPLRVPLAPPDECEFSVIALRDVLAGRRTAADFEPYFGPYKLLEADLENIHTVKLEPFESMNMRYWDHDADPSAWMRLYSLMVGSGPLVDTEYNRIYSVVYSMTDTMEARWPTLQTMEDEVFLQIILGIEPIEAFDRFVEEWLTAGGEIITREVADTRN
jgi:putative aldouronate transport system substrate-binding protein